jgi:predicted nucleic acid-binding protein
LGDEVFGDECESFLLRIEAGGLLGVVNSIVISEVLYNFLRAEMAEKYGKSYRAVGRYIKENPKVLREVNPAPVSKLFAMQNLFTLEPSKNYVVDKIPKYTSSYNLLSNDLIIALTMKENHITDIATSDPDFERVEGIKVWKP